MVGGPKAQRAGESKFVQQVRRRGRSAAMRMSFLEWSARVATLVLAGMVTLSILGSIAAISNEAPGGRASVPPGDLPPPAAAPAAEVSPSPAPAAAPDPRAARSAGPEEASAPAPAAAQAGTDRDRWLEAIAYALLALAGISLIAVLLLWNALRQLRRIADAAEAPGRN